MKRSSSHPNSFGLRKLLLGKDQLSAVGMIAQSDEITSNRLRSALYAVLYVCILLAAIALRLHDLEVRPLHSDEGVNHHFVSQVLKTGVYEYSHQNYHGPTYFFLSSWLVDLCGDSVSALRLLSVIAGVCLAATALLVRQLYARTFLLVATLLIAISPSLLFFSRYAIHEMLFVTLGAVCALSILQFIHSQKASWLYSISVTLALLIATKETFVVFCACIALAALVEQFVETEEGICSRLWLALKGHTTRAILVLGLVLIGVFSSGFISFQGVRELALGVPQWLGRGVSDEGHFKPVRYFLDMLWITEPLLLIIPIVLIITLIYLLAKKELLASTSRKPLQGIFFFGIWGTAALLGYSIIPYKTPWLIINITLPLTLALASMLTLLFQGGPKRKALSLVLGLAHILLSLEASSSLNYSSNLPIIKQFSRAPATPYGPANPYSYVHTAPEFYTFLQHINDYWSSNPEAMVLVACENYWPLPYYLRDNEDLVRFVSPDNYLEYLDKYDVLVLNKGESLSDDQPFISSTYRLSDVQESTVWYRSQS